MRKATIRQDTLTKIQNVIYHAQPLSPVSTPEGKAMQADGVTQEVHGIT